MASTASIPICNANPAPWLGTEGDTIVWNEDGFRVTFLSPGAVVLHPGHSLNVDQSNHFGWQNGAGGYGNAAISWVELTRADGGAFDLLAFDYLTYAGPVDENAMRVNAIGRDELWFWGEGNGAPEWTNVTKVWFRGASVRGYTLDNIQLALPGAGAVPEPQAWAFLTLGFGLIGAGMRARRAKLAFA